MEPNTASLVCRAIPAIQASETSASTELSLFRSHHEAQFRTRWLSGGGGGRRRRGGGGFAVVSMSEKREEREIGPSLERLVKHPVALAALVPKEAALFAAGAIAGAAAKTVTAPLDRVKLIMQTHGLRIGQESAKKAMGFVGAITMIGREEGLKGYWKGNLPQVAMCMLRDEGMASFFKGLGPSLIGIAPYIAVNFCVFDLVKKSLPEEYQKRPESSLLTALVSATLATLKCYPLDTVRRQMQMRGTPYKTVLDALPGIVERDGWLGLYRGFVPNALKTLPNSSIRLTTFDTVKGWIAAGEKELLKIKEENQKDQKLSTSN